MMLSKEDCPKGLECGVHYRLSDHVNTPSIISLIDYVGEYAVFTQTTSDLDYTRSLLASEPVDAVTQVHKVGDKAIADVIQNPEDLSRVQVAREEISIPLDAAYMAMADAESARHFNGFIENSHQNMIELVKAGKIQ
jgi:hypothetical protein